MKTPKIMSASYACHTGVGTVAAETRVLDLRDTGPRVRIVLMHRPGIIQPSMLSVVLALMVASFGLSACGGRDDGAGSTTASGRLAVVATTTQVADFARVIGGDRVEVTGILGANVDPHDFEPAPGDMERLSDAGVIVRSGVGIDAWLDRMIESSDTTAAVLDASAGVELRQGAPGGDGPSTGDEQDPHIWHNPLNAKVMVTNIANAFKAVAPADVAVFDANLTAYLRQLDELDAEVAGELATLTNPKLVTNHDAFGYYIDRYGLTFVGSIIPSFDSSAEPSAADISTLAAAIRAQGVRAIFLESSLPPDLGDALAKDAGVAIIEGDDALYGDTLGPPGSDGDTYLKMIRHNTATIVGNLK